MVYGAKTRPDQRVGFRSRTRDRTCAYCDVSINHKRPQARWCGPACANRGWHRRQRLDALARRPRCMICSAPILYGTTGVRLTKTRTCGRRNCRSKANRWFGRMVA